MRSNKAFTLVELMIVISIVGMLSTIAIPKFVDMMRKANEAVTKSNLGVLWSVTSIYYADHDGVWPYQNTAVAGDGSGNDSYSLMFAGLDGAAAIAPKYIKAVPVMQTGQRLLIDGLSEVAVAIDGGTFDYDTRIEGNQAAAWVYLKDIGMWYINCDELDTKGVGIHTW